MKKSVVILCKHRSSCVRLGCCCDCGVFAKDELVGHHLNANSRTSSRKRRGFVLGFLEEHLVMSEQLLISRTC